MSLPGPDLSDVKFPDIIAAQSVAEDLRYAETCRTLIIDRVFNILVKIIETLQKTAATQSDRLKIYTEWQKAYTDKMDQVPAFTASNSAYNEIITKADDDDSKGARDDLNKTNSTFTEQLRGRRSVVSDDAKSLQTNVNQSSDAVNQQTNMATSLLQQLSTILGSIFK